ncbi:MAG: HAD family hydrolase [Solobacterium sp.]|nr:HAD family hydrolase [Solobacterium sp.]
MIKLIATDIDGTFLSTGHTYDKERFGRLFERLLEKDIHFAIASGNQFACMYNTYLPFSKDMYFICDNGAILGHGNRTLAYSTMKPEHVAQLLHAAEPYQKLVILMSCVEHSYILRSHQDMQEMLEHYFTNMILVDDLYAVQEPVLKCSLIDPADNIIRYLDEFVSNIPGELNAVTAGNECIDIMPREISKGSGIRQLQNILNIRPEECMCFGDQMNDRSMFPAVKYSYAMENAVRPLKDIAWGIAPHCDDSGVLQVIEHMLDHPEEYD